MNKKDFKGNLRIDIKVPNASPYRIETPATIMLDDDGDYFDDEDAIVTIYSLVIPHIETVLDTVDHSQKSEIVKLLHDKKDDHRHCRGLVYYIRSPHQGKPPVMCYVQRNYAATIFKKCVSDTFVFDFDLAVACSIDTTILFNGVSSLVDGVVNTYGGDLTNYRPDDDDPSVGVFSQNVLRPMTKEEAAAHPCVPLEVDVGEDEDSNDTSDYKIGNSNYNTRGRSRGIVYNTPINIGNNLPNVGNAARRYSLILRNIPASKRKLPANHPVGHLCCKKDETASERLNALTAIGIAKVPESRHRNKGKLKDSAAIASPFFLCYYTEFEKRESEHGLYVPPLAAYDPNSDMGREWEESLLPDELYVKYSAMNVAIKEDLLYLSADSEPVLNVIRNASGGYNALHSLLKIKVPMLRDMIANSKLLDYVQGTSIALHVRSVHEYVLQCSLAGTKFSHYQIWKMIIKFLPDSIRMILNTAGTNLIHNNMGSSSSKDTPYNLRLENVTAFIISELQDVNIKFPKQTSALKSDPLDSPQIMAFQRKNRKCYICHATDHIASSCPQRKKEHGNQQDGRRSNFRPSFQQRNQSKNRGDSRQSFKPAVNVIDKDEPTEGHDNDIKEEHEEEHQEMESEDIVKFGDDDGKDTDHSLMVGAIALDGDSTSSEQSIVDDYQLGDEFGGVYAFQAGEDEPKWEDIVSPDNGLITDSDHDDHNPGFVKCDVCWDTHSTTDCHYTAKKLKSARSYAKKLKKVKSEEEEAAIEKKPAAIRPCPIKTLFSFGRVIAADDKYSTYKLALWKLKKSFRAMKLPEKVSFDIIEDVIARFDNIRLWHGNFSSVEAEAEASQILEDTTSSLRDLMQSMRVDIEVAEENEDE